MTVYVIAPPVGSNPDFTVELPCGADLTAFSRIWTMTGTFPDDYPLDQQELDLLGTLNRDNNIAVYHESSDNWGFSVVNGVLSDRDGVSNEITGTFDIPTEMTRSRRWSRKTLATASTRSSISRCR